MAEGLAVQLDTGRYAHGMAMLQVAHVHYTQIERLMRRTAEAGQVDAELLHLFDSTRKYRT